MSLIKSALKFGRRLGIENARDKTDAMETDAAVAQTQNRPLGKPAAFGIQPSARKGRKANSRG